MIKTSNDNDKIFEKIDFSSISRNGHCHFLNGIVWFFYI